MDPFSDLLAVAVVSLLAAISPGPDFFIALKNSLSYSRKAGLYTVAGIFTAVIIHLSYTMVGIAVVIAESPVIYSIVKYGGIAYLLYIGVSSVISSFKESHLDVNYKSSQHEISPFKAYSQGFLTNLLNPKIAIFMISLFSQFIDPSTPALIKFEYALINWSVSLAWFVALVLIVTSRHLLGKINRFRQYVDRVMGGILIILGIKLLAI